MKLYWTPRSCAMGIAVLLEEVETEACEMMDYAIDTLHGQGTQPLFFPSRFAKDPAHEAAVKEDGKAMARKVFGFWRTAWVMHLAWRARRFRLPMLRCSTMNAGQR